MRKNEEARNAVLKVLRAAKRSLSRAEIAERIGDGTNGDSLPLAAMQREGTVIRSGVTRNSGYAAVRK